MQKKSVTLVAIGALLLASVAAWFALSHRPTMPEPGGAAKTGATGDKAAAASAASAKGPPAAPVVVYDVQPVTLQEDLQAVGSLRSNESVVLRPEVSGRIASIDFRDGQPVAKGDLLVALDDALNRAEVAQARAEYELAQSNLKRTEDLARKNFVSSSAQDQAASNLEVAAAKLKLAEARLAKMRIVSPFDGVAGIRNVSVGDYVREGADLVNIEDIRTLKVDFRLPERLFAQIRVGQPIEVVADALPDKRSRGVVDAVNPRVDASGRSLELRGRLTNPGNALRPGMFVRVRVIVGERDNALLVPEEAIVPAGQDFYVWKVVDGKSQRAKVRVGVRREAKVEIVDGLAPGDRVVVEGQLRLARDGQPVRIANGAAPAAEQTR